MNTSIVLIHGTNSGPWTMDNFAQYFSEHGYECHSPAYRFHDRPHSKEAELLLKNLSISDYVDDVVRFIETLVYPPILVGHSLGGIVAQKVAEKGLAVAIILLNGSVNWGILPSTNEERELGKMLMSAGAFWKDVLLPDFETMARYGLNRLELADQRKIFDRLSPESGRVMFELFFWMFDENLTTRIDYERITCPVLMVSGSEDLAIPPSTSRQIADRHGPETTFYEARGFGHYLMFEQEWKHIAEFCIDWIRKQRV